MKRWLIKYWFMAGLLGVTMAVMVDSSQWTISIGRWLKSHHGPDIVIVLIFFLSGMVLDAVQIRKGLADLPATGAALLVIFVVAPLVALIGRQLPLNVQILTGLCLVAVMPTTLSSGVVMTGAAGGNMAHALFVTIVANALAVLTIPFGLSILISGLGSSRVIEIDKAAITLKIALLVLAPLLAGLAVRAKAHATINKIQSKVQWINQGMILAIVWMALCQSRPVLVSHLSAMLPIIGLVFLFHLLLLAAAFGMATLLGLPPGRRESVIFMGGQKTLPLSVILQVKLFPDFGLTLVFCVAHHIIHLIMDGYLVEKLKQRR